MELSNPLPGILVDALNDLHEDRIVSSIPCSTSSLKQFSKSVGFLKTSKIDSLLDITTYFNIYSFDYRDKFANDNSPSSGPLLLLFMFYARLYPKLISSALGQGNILLFGPIKLDDHHISFREVVDFMEDFNTERPSLLLTKLKWQRIWETVTSDHPVQVGCDKWSSRLNFHDFLSLLIVAADVCMVPPAWRGLDTRIARVRRFLSELGLADVISTKAILLNCFRDRHMQRFSDYPSDVSQLPHRATLLARPKGPVAPLPARQRPNNIDDSKLRGILEKNYVHLSKKPLWEAYEGPWIDMGISEIGGGGGIEMDSTSGVRSFRIKIVNRRLHTLWFQASVEGCEAVRVVCRQTPLSPGCSAEVSVDVFPKHSGEWTGNVCFDAATAKGEIEKIRIPFYLRCVLPGCIPRTQMVPIHVPKHFRLKSNCAPGPLGAHRPSYFDPSMILGSDAGISQQIALLGPDGQKRLQSLGGGTRPGSAFTFAGIKLKNQTNNAVGASNSGFFVGDALLGRKSRSVAALPSFHGVDEEDIEYFEKKALSRSPERRKEQFDATCKLVALDHYDNIMKQKQGSILKNDNDDYSRLGLINADSLELEFGNQNSLQNNFSPKRLTDGKPQNISENDEIFGSNGAIGRSILDPSAIRSKNNMSSTKIQQFDNSFSASGVQSLRRKTAELKKLTFAPATAHEVNNVVERRLLGGELGAFNSYNARHGSIFSDRSDTILKNT